MMSHRPVFQSFFNIFLHSAVAVAVLRNRYVKVLIYMSVHALQDFWQGETVLVGTYVRDPDECRLK